MKMNGKTLIYIMELHDALREERGKRINAENRARAYDADTARLNEAIRRKDELIRSYQSGGLTA